MNQSTVFDRIISKEIPSKVVFQDENILAFRDVNPQAPTHIVIIPKQKNGLIGLSNATEEHSVILGKLLLAASKIAKQEKLQKGYRIVINDGENGCQTVMHIHLHLIGGKQLGWPPG